MEILRIIKDHDVTITENNNGIFFNMSTLDDDVFGIIEEFVNYCYDNKHELDRYDQKLHECKFLTKTKHISYSVNEPKDIKNNLSDLVESLDKSGKVTDFVTKLYSSTEKLNIKRGSGKFMICKKRFTKKPVIDDSLADALERDE